MLLYQIVNLANGRVYVGQTSRSLGVRWKEHRSQLRHNRHGNRYLQAAWNQYGEDKFQIQVLAEYSNAEELNKAEIEFLKTHSDLYNLAEGGNGHQHSVDAIQAIVNAQSIPIVGMDIRTGEIRKYRSATEAESAGFNAACVRKCAVGYETKPKGRNSFRSISHKGWVWAEDSDGAIDILNERRREAFRAKVRKERAVVGMNMLTKEVKSFRSAQEAGRNGFSGTTVYRACLGRIRMHRGYVWAFVDSGDPQSLLQEKAMSILTNPPRGPKSWR